VPTTWWINVFQTLGRKWPLFLATDQHPSHAAAGRGVIQSAPGGRSRLYFQYQNFSVGGRRIRCTCTSPTAMLASLRGGLLGSEDILSGARDPAGDFGPDSCRFDHWTPPHGTEATRATERNRLLKLVNELRPPKQTRLLHLSEALGSETVLFWQLQPKKE